MVEQTKIIPKSEKIPVKGGVFIFHPVGSQYKDPDTKQMITRDVNHLQYAKAGMPTKWEFGKADFENLADLTTSDKGKGWIESLPDVGTLEPNSA